MSDGGHHNGHAPVRVDAVILWVENCLVATGRDEVPDVADPEELNGIFQQTFSV